MTEFASWNFSHLAIWLISAASIALVLIRPRGIAEVWWSALGACCLIIFRLVSPLQALQAVRKGVDVYLFLAGMMIMSEIARREGVFDWVAAHAVRIAKGSRKRLFALIYCVGVGVTTLLSNDATAVVLTPAVLAAVKAAEAEPLPYLLTCAFIANAASFVLPISNPANLVVYRQGLPPLGKWLFTFGLPSLASILVTFLVLRLLSTGLLKGGLRSGVDFAPLSRQGKTTLLGIALLAAALMTSSALNVDLGAPALAVGVLVMTIVAFQDHSVLNDVAKEVSWSVVPLVAGLFVLVEGMNNAGAQHLASHALRQLQSWRPIDSGLAAAFGIALISNIMNNLPSGLIAGGAVQAAHIAGELRSAVLIGVDLGPNLSVSGSLATILWLIAIRREGQNVGFWRFLKWGALVMTPALTISILALYV
ncbi:MAG: arsenic transporter [Acidobacteriota bacterium]|nr:arsenic transporter [Acidobacteriota bacterium]